MKFKILKILLLCSLIPVLFFALFIAFTSYLNKSKEKDGIPKRNIVWEEQIVKDNPITLEEFSEGGGRFADISSLFPETQSSIYIVLSDRITFPYVSVENGGRLIAGRLIGRSDNTFDVEIFNQDKTASYISLGHYNGKEFSGNLNKTQNGVKDDFMLNASLAILAFLFCIGGYYISCIKLENELDSNNGFSFLLAVVSGLVVIFSFMLWVSDGFSEQHYYLFKRICHKEIIFPVWFCISEIGFLEGISCYLTKKQMVNNKVYRDFFDRNSDKLPHGASPKGEWKEVDGDSVIIIDEKGYLYHSSNDEDVEKYQITAISDGVLILKGKENVMKLAKFTVHSQYPNIRSVEFEEEQFTKTGQDIDSEVNKIKLKKEKKRARRELFEKSYSILLKNLSISSSEANNRVIKWSAWITGIFLFLAFSDRIYGSKNYNFKFMAVFLVIALTAAVFLIRNLWLKYYVERKRERLRDIIEETMENENLSQEEIIKQSEEAFVNN